MTFILDPHRFVYTPQSDVFAYTGYAQEFVVPDGVTSVTITAKGAKGYTSLGTGGSGASVTGDIVVTPFEKLIVQVGGQGTAGTASGGGGGYNGGGGAWNNWHTGGGGGGGSDVRQGGSALANRVIVAGGGGGGSGGTSAGGNGGAGGATNGANGTGPNPGFGATTSAGGAAGGGTPFQGSAGETAGTLGQGGQGQNTGSAPRTGGGGGGYYGGGGGGDPTAENTNSCGGGGGSSLVPAGGSSTSGVQAGNGEITVAWVGPASYSAQTISSPSDLTGLRVWLDADSIGQADGTKVAGWTDLSGNSISPVQAADDKRPTYKTAIINGKAVVRFDGTNDILELASGGSLSPTTGEWTIFAVAKVTNVAAVRDIVTGESGPDPGGRYLYCNTGPLRSTARNTASGQFSSQVGTISTTAFSIMSAVRGPFTVQTFLDGTGSTVTPTTGTPEPGSSPTEFRVGGAAGSVSLLVGDVAEVVAYSRALTTREREAVEAYLRTKYAL